jgi:hypothetical protein
MIKTVSYKQTIIFLFFWGILFVNNGNAQNNATYEKYGNTFNIGLGAGIGNYGYAFYAATPAVHLDYEFDLIRTLTIAPFVTLYHYRNGFYHERVIPVGLKATCYFDQILKAHSKWDFYLAGSLGYAFRETVWETGFAPDPNTSYGPGALYLVLSIGSEYHINKRLGAFIDLSNGISTIGLSIHH